MPISIFSPEDIQSSPIMLNAKGGGSFVNMYNRLWLHVISYSGLDIYLQTSRATLKWFSPRIFLMSLSL